MRGDLKLKFRAWLLGTAVFDAYYLLGLTSWWYVAFMLALNSALVPLYLASHGRIVEH